MAELITADVERYTSGRLAANSAETQRLLSAGLTAARRFCGWHVTLVEADVVTLDGPGSSWPAPSVTMPGGTWAGGTGGTGTGLARSGSGLLVLPTLRLVELTAVVENGVAVDVAADLFVSARGLVRKRSGGCWSANYGSIVVTMDHGFEDADDFNAAVLSFVDRSSLAAAGGRLTAVGPFLYASEAMAGASAFSVVERALLEQYRLESAP